jgi:hypothetical protein
MPLLHLRLAPPTTLSNAGAVVGSSANVFYLEITHKIAMQNVRLKTCVLTSNDATTALDGGDGMIWLGFNQNIVNARQIATSLPQGGGLVPVPCSYSADRDATQIIYADLGIHTHTWVEAFTVSVYGSDGVTALPLSNLTTDTDLAKKLSSIDLLIEYDDVEMPR